MLKDINFASLYLCANFLFSNNTSSRAKTNIIGIDPSQNCLHQQAVERNILMFIDIL